MIWHRVASCSWGDGALLREIVLDTETTGLDASNGDRVIEIGCIELVNRFPTGREFHVYINPERDVPAEAEAVHGLSTAFLSDKPLFAAIADEFLAFIDTDPLVIHNAGFDVAFLNAELARLGRQPIVMDRVVDTLMLARRKNPAGPNNLDALCRRFGVDSSKRVKHGALLDSLLLSEVYLELIGARQASLVLGHADARLASQAGGGHARAPAVQRPAPLPNRLTAEAEALHRTFVETLGPKALWLRYVTQSEAAE